MQVDRLRFSGLSGIDTESMIKKLMDAQRKPLESMKQKKQILEWKREDYRNINALLLDLRKAANEIRYESSFRKKAASSSNESVVKAVSVSSNSLDGVHLIKVNQLATGANLVSGSKLGVTNSADPISDLDTSFTVNGITIEVKKDDSLDTIISKINAVKGTTGVQASYDKANDLIFFSSTKTGSDAKIQLGEDTTTFLKDKLKIDNFSEIKGQDARITYNGADYTFSSNTININGLNLTLTGKSTEEITISVSNDTEAIFNSIKKFIDKYNEVIDAINKKLGEERYRDYLPLTDAQKEEMSEKQIELWENKAKSGLIRHDSMIESILGQFRLDFSTSVGSSKADEVSLFSFGIETGDYKSKGKLIIKDEAKLKEALISDPDKVVKLFTNYSNSSDPKVKYAESGIAERLYRNVDQAIQKLTEKAGAVNSSDFDSNLLGREIKEWDLKIKDFEKKLVRIEDQYWKQFSAMEKALQKANAQAGWLLQQSGG